MCGFSVVGLCEKKMQLFLAAVFFFCAGRHLSLIRTLTWKAIKRSSVLAWHGPACCLFKKKKIFSSLVRLLASAGRPLAVCLFPWQLGPDLLDQLTGVRRLQNLSKILQIVWHHMFQAAPDL